MLPAPCVVHPVWQRQRRKEDFDCGIQVVFSFKVFVMLFVVRRPGFWVFQHVFLHPEQLAWVARVDQRDEDDCSEQGSFVQRRRLLLLVFGRDGQPEEEEEEEEEDGEEEEEGKPRTSAMVISYKITRKKIITPTQYAQRKRIFGKACLLGTFFFVV